MMCISWENFCFLTTRSLGSQFSLQSTFWSCLCLEGKRLILGVCCHLLTRTNLDKTPMNTFAWVSVKVVRFCLTSISISKTVIKRRNFGSFSNAICCFLPGHCSFHSDRVRCRHHTYLSPWKQQKEIHRNHHHWRPLDKWDISCGAHLRWNPLQPKWQPSEGNSARVQ